ncbi:glycosyltransferase [Actinosynnema sp. NPDC020468]|uniref:glycosyltransferase n=1 Tax=Actinosynnema sp. NPDC020468 TaxID=3154488 RepID=UPI0033FD9DBA
MTGQVVYLAPDFAEPSGGMRAIYRHAETARAAGLDAKVWHFAEDFKCDWFATSATVVRGASLDLGPNDLLVVPEVMVLTGFDPAPGVRKVVYNQNHFYTFDNFEGAAYPGWSPAPAVWTASDVSVAVLRRLHPDLAVLQVPYAIDGDVFRSAATRKRRVVWMPRKRRREAALLEVLFRNDPRFADVELVPLDGASEAHTADVLAEASVFVALGAEEGFGLPVPEALAAGCAVVGYPAGGGAELFTAPNAHEIADADVLAVVDEVARLLDSEPDRAASRSWVLERYSTARMADALLGAIDVALAMPADGGTATHPLARVDTESGDDLAEAAAQVERATEFAEEQAAARERAKAFAEEQTAARERAESIAQNLEDSFQAALGELTAARQKAHRLENELADLRVEYKELGTAAERLTALDQTAALLAQYTRDNDRLNRRLDEEIRQATHVRRTLEERVAELEHSTSWKVTAPLRRASDRMRGDKRG